MENIKQIYKIIANKNAQIKGLCKIQSWDNRIVIFFHFNWLHKIIFVLFLNKHTVSAKDVNYSSKF